MQLRRIGGWSLPQGGRHRRSQPEESALGVRMLCALRKRRWRRRHPSSHEPVFKRPLRCCCISTQTSSHRRRLLLLQLCCMGQDGMDCRGTMLTSVLGSSSQGIQSL